MTPLFVDRISRAQPRGTGYPQLEQHYREVMRDGREIRVEAGRRAEFAVGAGQRPMILVAEGSVRFEGDDTAAQAGDVVSFQQAVDEDARIGIEADAAFRGWLVIRPRAD